MLVDASPLGLQMTFEEIQTRLRIFNETYDYSVFNDIPPEQQIYVMYPHVLKFGDTKEEHTKILDRMFGPLSENYKSSP